MNEQTGLPLAASEVQPILKRMLYVECSRVLDRYIVAGGEKDAQAAVLYDCLSEYFEQHR
jgi:hypothetical protein